jgi:polysaccharide deacetylase family protein (PEP-CTERM system associated)
MTTTTPSPVVNALTVDVEDYFQVSAFADVVRPEDWDSFERRVAGNTERLLQIFEEAGVKATFFILGWVAEREPELIRRIAASGHEVASHGYGHRLVYEQSRDEFRDDVRRSRALLQSLSGQAILGYRAPSFSVTANSLWALEILQQEGFLYDASIFPIRHDRYGMPSAPRHPFTIGPGVRHPFVGALDDLSGSLVEIPASTVRALGTNLPVAGGGYFRLLPYAWCRWGIRRLNQVEGRPAVFYLHPWEVDPEQPRLQASWLSRLRHYRNLSKTEERLRRLLADFSFGPVEEAILAPVTMAVRRVPVL